MDRGRLFNGNPKIIRLFSYLNSSTTYLSFNSLIHLTISNRCGTIISSRPQFIFRARNSMGSFRFPKSTLCTLWENCLCCQSGCLKIVVKHIFSTKKTCLHSFVVNFCFSFQATGNETVFRSYTKGNKVSLLQTQLISCTDRGVFRECIKRTSYCDIHLNSPAFKYD